MKHLHVCSLLLGCGFAQAEMVSSYDIAASNAYPIPAAVWLLVSSLGYLLGWARRKASYR
jgi:hypothetical protein